MPDNYNIIILTYFQLYLKLRKIITLLYIIMTTEMKVHVVTLQVCFKVCFQVCFQVCLLVIEGLYSIRTNIFEILKIYLGNFLETYLYHTCTEEYKPSITSKHT